MAVVSLVLMAACATAPSATATPARTGTPAPVTLALPVPWAPPPAPAGQCYLPVSWHAPGVPDYWQDGFLLYPAGTMYASAPMHTWSGQGTFYASTAIYDRVVGRFLPVPPEAISPDRLSFVYADYDLPPSPLAGMAGQKSAPGAGGLATSGRVHLVDARTGSDRILFEGAPTYRVVGYTPDGIYLTQVLLTMDGAFASGLYRMSTSVGRPVAVAGGDRPLDSGGWSVMNGAAWGVDYSIGGGIQGGNRLVRLDLQTGVAQVWLTRPEGTGLTLIGFDLNSGALVLAYASGYSSTGTPAPTPATEVWSVSGPNAGRVIYTTSDQSAPFPNGPASADSHGVWMGGLESAVLLDTGDGLLKVDVPVNAVIAVSGSRF